MPSVLDSRDISLFLALLKFLSIEKFESEAVLLRYNKC